MDLWVMLREEDIHTGRSASLRLRGGFVGWISEYIGLIIPFAVFEDLPGSVCLWQRGRQGGGRRKPVTDGFFRPLGRGSRGNLLPAAHVTDCEAGWSLRPLQREAKRSEGPESRRECVREERRLDQATTHRTRSRHTEKHQVNRKGIFFTL